MFFIFNNKILNYKIKLYFFTIKEIYKIRFIYNYRKENMNLLKTQLKSITTQKDLKIMEVVFDNETLYMILLELPINLNINDSVTLGIKPLHIAISKNFHVDTSFLNQIKVSVIAIEVGELLTAIEGVVNGVILQSVITTKAYYRLGINIGDTVIMLLPASELFIV